MVITEVNSHDVIKHCRDALRLTPAVDSPLDTTLLAAMLRRSAGIHCPCSKATLRTSLLDSLTGLGVANEALIEMIDETIEGLIVGGDLLELHEVTTTDTNVKGTWVFAAPPSFIERPSGSIFLTGIVPDQDHFLPAALAARVVTEGITRQTTPEPGEDLSKELRELGLRQLPETLWLKTPKSKTETAREHLDVMDRLLSKSGPSGSISELQILATTEPVRYYKGRWQLPAKHTGHYVGRRPQEYGAPIWCYVALVNGAPTKLVDFPVKRSKWRGCDAAWLLQMAIDACASQPQQYRLTEDQGGVRFDFFSPLPQWAERRFIIFGKPSARKDCLLSYWLPKDEAAKEEEFIQQRLWLVRSEK